MDEMKAGRELDALIAEKVMGWRHKLHIGLNKMVWEDERGWQYEPKRYSTDIAAAWEVVEKIKSNSKNCDHDPWVRFCSEIDYIIDGDNVFKVSFFEINPHRLCLAALKAVGNE